MNPERRERRNQASREWRAKNQERVRKYNKQYHSEHKETRTLQHKAWVAANRGSKNALISKRRAAKLQRTPQWADMKEIELIYKQSASLTKLLGKQTNVDHIIPLQGRLISGLHVPDNMQIMYAEDNQSKANTWIT